MRRAICLDRAEAEVVLETIRQPGTTIWMSADQIDTLKGLEHHLTNYLQALQAERDDRA